jgi:uncharacterized membrane protein
MTTIQPRHPVLGLIRLFALAWTLLSLLGVIVGVLALLYFAAWGCVGHHQGWFGCTLGTAILPFAWLVSLFMAVVALIFAQIFYVAGARAERVELRRPSLRRGVRHLIGEVLMDILD